VYSAPTSLLYASFEVGGAFGTHGSGETVIQDFGGKARRKETTRKTGVEMGGWDQNGS
jgi:hypothetical protein